MARTQLLQEWALEEFGEHVPSYATLCMYARNNMISPPAIKAGRMWIVDKNARFVGLSAAPKIKKKDSPKLIAILQDGI